MEFVGSHYWEVHLVTPENLIKTFKECHQDFLLLPPVPLYFPALLTSAYLH
jgi:hypothetical protein